MEMGSKPVYATFPESQSSKFLHKDIVIYNVKGFVQVQEEHSTGTPLIDIPENIMKEVYETRAC